MRKSIVLGSIVAMGFAGAAVADDSLNYSFLEGSYFNANDVNLDGWEIGGSYAFTKNVHGFAGYSQGQFDGGPDLDSFKVGLGVNWPIAPKVDLIGQVAYLSADLDPGASDNGIGLSARVRGVVAPNFELEGGVNYTNFDKADDDTSFDIGGRYFFTPAFALGADVDFNSGDETWKISLRWNFPKK